MPNLISINNKSGNNKSGQSSLSSSDNDPDSALIKQIAAGNQLAFATLVDRHISSLSALATHMIGDVHMAEDITQSVFMKTWNMLPHWQPGQAKLITWMRRVATNLCLDYLRKHKPIYTDILPDSPDNTPNPDETLSNQQRNKIIHIGLQALPGRQKAALTLFYFQELSLKESAEIMNISTSAYESLLRRARTALKSQLEPQMRHAHD